MKNTTSDEDGKHVVFLAIIIVAIIIAAFLLPRPPEEVPIIEEPTPSAGLIQHAEASEPEPRIVMIATTSNHIVEPDDMGVEKTVEKVKLRPELVAICKCESAGHTHKDQNGVLLSGYVDSDDKGECQINTRYHGKTMEKMGLDINNDVDYRTYANHLFDTMGRQPWMASASCWAPIIGYQ